MRVLSVSVWLSKAFSPLKNGRYVLKSRCWKTEKHIGLTLWETAVFQIDGNVIRVGHKCDKLLLIIEATTAPDKGTAVFIELKGRDIDHAIEQLEATINNQLFIPYPTEKERARARIVTAGCGPKSSSRKKLEEARIRFRNRYNIGLRVLKHNQPDTQLSI